MTIYLSPYRRMAGLREAMNRLIEESMAENTPAERELLLAVDVIAQDDDYVLTAFVPGLEAEDLSLEILNNTVSLRGEFKSEEKEGVKYLTSELPSGRFSRVVSLPTALDPAKVEATIKNGVLTLRLPKAEAHRPKAIKINTVN
jgi:HSP20 family protein